MPSISLDIKNLNDEELFKALTECGMNPGPIVASTRKLYEKKLANHLAGDDVTDFINGEDSNYQEDDYYQNSTEEQYESSPTVRRRMNENENKTSTKDEQNFSFDHSMHTPSARPSLRSVVNTSTSTTKTIRYSTPEGCFRETETLRYNYGAGNKNSQTNKSSFKRFLVKIMIILILIGILFSCYHYMYRQNPFEELENLARQTVASMQDKSKTSKTKPNIPPKSN